MKARYRHIDVAKGIGIILVVFGHNWIVRSEKGELFRVIFSFHMPLFFFLSGIWFDPRVKLRRLVLGKADALLKPYLVTLAAVGAYRVLYKADDPTAFASGVLYATGVSIPWGWVSLWFLAHLWCVFVFAGLLQRLWAYDRAGWFGRSVLLAVLLGVGFWSMHSFWNVPLTGFGLATSTTLYGLPLGLDLLGVSSFFFLLGVFTRSWMLDMRPRALPMLLAVAAFAACHYFFDATIDLNLRVYDSLVISTIEALAGTYIVLWISVAIAEWPVLGAVLAYFGAASLFVLIFHDYAQDRVFTGLQARQIGTDLVRAWLAFAAGLIVPLVVFELARRVRLIGLALLPFKRRSSAVGSAA
ncbi:MAG: acyltransferase family protein [Methylotetracoccus sp.]